MSRSCRPCTPPLALAALNAAIMPIRIFWPSSLVGPLSAAEIPNRISVSVTPRKVLLGSCPSAPEFGASDACCVCAGEGGGESDAAAGTGEECAGCATEAGADCAPETGAGCGTRAGAGRATEATVGGAFAARRSQRPFEGAASAVRSDAFEDCATPSRALTPCTTGLKVTIPSATTAASAIIGENRTNNDDVLSSDRGGGSGIRSGQESYSGVVSRSRCKSV